MIHPNACVHPKAELDPTTDVGPFAVIDPHVVLGPHCVVGPHVHLTGHTTIGAGNVFFAGAVVGEAPQDLKYRGAPSQLRVGDNNRFRECVTVHRSNDETEDTVIGSDCLFMACSHIAHNCHIGNHVILANGALLGGHVHVEDRAIISGNALVHQFVRIGTLAMMQGGSAISKDLPPFTVARGVNTMSGLNTIGLRRAGLSSEERLELRQLFHRLFRSGQSPRDALEQARLLFTREPSRRMLDFVASCRRSIVRANRAHALRGADDEGES